MSPTDQFSIFVDITVLVEFCNTHGKESEEAREVLERINEDGGKVFIAKKAGKELTKRVANKQRLFHYLFNKSSEYIRDFDNPETKFKAEVLNYTDIEDNLPGGLNNDYLPDIAVIKDHLDEVGLKEFRREIDIAQRRSHQYQKQLEKSVIDERFSYGGQDTFYMELSINSLTDDETQVESLVTAIMWCQGDKSSRNTILIRHSDPIYENEEDFLECVPSHTREYLELISPRDTLDRIGKQSVS